MGTRVLDQSVTAHASDSTNPHATDLANLGAGTIAEFNAHVSDGDFDDDGDARTPSSHAASHVAGDVIQSATSAQAGLATAAQVTAQEAATAALVAVNAGDVREAMASSTALGGDERHVAVNTNGGIVTVTLPAIAALTVDRVVIWDEGADGTGNAGTNGIVIATNGAEKINGSGDDLHIHSDNGFAVLELNADKDEWAITGAQGLMNSIRWPVLLFARTTVTPAQIRALSGSPITLVGSPVAGHILVPIRVVFYLDWGSAQHGVAGKGDLVVEYASGVDLLTQQGNGFIDSAGDAIRLCGIGSAAIQDLAVVDNEAIQLTNDAADFDGAGDSPLIVDVFYYLQESPL